jgi:hypothetical protein
MLVAALLTGCQEGRNTAKVSGRVTLDGQPVADVLVHFQPQISTADAAKKTTDATDSSGITNAEGKYELHLADSDKPGALVGKHIVRFSDRRATSDEDAGPSKAPPSRFPARYSDGSRFRRRDGSGQLRADVEVGWPSTRA